MKHPIVAAAMAAVSLHASAGWFDVSNYEGKVGGKTLFLSVQTLDQAHPDGPADSRFVVGSFYDPGERRPKAFHGKRTRDGRLLLCETQQVKAFVIPERDSWLQMKKEPCRIALASQDERLAGTWGAAPAAFHRVGMMNNVGSERVTGRMQIPLWAVDTNYMYVGTWGLKHGRLMLVSLDAIGLASGRRERSAALDCIEPGHFCPGLLYTEPYLAAMTGYTPGTVTVGYSDGTEARDEGVTLQPVR